MLIPVTQFSTDDLTIVRSSSYVCLYGNGPLAWPTNVNGFALSGLPLSLSSAGHTPGRLFFGQ